MIGSTYASYGKRVGAFVIDVVLCYILIMVLAGIGGAFLAGGSSAGGGVFLLMALAASWLYFLGDGEQRADAGQEDAQDQGGG